MVGKIDAIKRLRVFGDFLMLGTFFMLLWLFLSAYLSNDFSATLHINNHGEAHIEMIILVFFLLPLSLLTVVFSFIDWRQTWKAKSEISSRRHLMEAPNLKRYPVEELECPRCGGKFQVKVTHFGGTITCPNCGLIGTYSPGYEGHEYKGDSDLKVRIIKDIRR